MTPIVIRPGKIHFDLDKRIPRYHFNNVLELFREYKGFGILSFDWEVEKWKMEQSALQKDKTLATTLRQRLLDARIHLQPFPGEENPYVVVEFNGKANVDGTIQSIVLDQAMSIAIIMRDKAFLIVTPKQQSFRHWKDFETRKKSQNRIDAIFKNDLTGVTDRVECYFHFANVGKIQSQVYQTYDVWLVAELLEILAADEHANVKVVVSDEAQEILNQRHTEKQQKRQPIPQVEKIRSSDVPLHPHQMEGVRFFMENGGRGLLGDEMGL